MRIELYTRKDGKWSWRAKAPNNRILAVDGNQGYENKGDATDIIWRLWPGIEIIELKDEDNTDEEASNGEA